MTLPRLHTYWRSGAAHRVRIALALKGIAYEGVPVHLVRDGGEHLRPAFRALNPQARVPVLELPSGEALIQSPAIIAYLDEVHPEPALLPREPLARARVRGVAALIGCDVHPLNNVSALAALRRRGQDDASVSAWISGWISAGFDAVETLIGEDGWCFGPEPGLADVYLVPQVCSARRFAVALDRYPRIGRVAALAATHAAFVAAAPENQADAA